MNLLTLIKELRRDPRKYIDPVSPISLGALIEGYGGIDPRARRMMRATIVPIGPNASLSAFTRMYLAEPDMRRGVAILLDKLEESLAQLPAVDTEGPSYAGRGFADVVSDVVKQNRPGMLFGEPTLTWLFHYSVGFDLAFEEFDPGAAKRDREELARFGEWLQRRLRWEIPVPWQRLLRVYEGEDSHGVSAFVRRWDEFVASSNTIH